MPEITIPSFVITGLQVILAFTGAFFVALWLSLIVWTFRDARARSRDIFAILLATLMVVVFGPLGLVLIPLVDKICQWRGGYPLAATSLHNCVREVHVPVMYVQSRMDLYVAGDQVESLYNATPEPKQLCWTDPPGGRLEAYRYVAANMEDLLAFANQQISKS